MEIKDFIAKFTDLFEDTDVSTFSSETDFRNLEEYSSIIALSIIGMVDEEYDVTLKGEEIKNSTSIRDLYNIVKNKM